MRVKAIFDDGGCLDCHSATLNLPFMPACRSQAISSRKTYPRRSTHRPDGSVPGAFGRQAGRRSHPVENRKISCRRLDADGQILPRALGIVAYRRQKEDPARLVKNTGRNTIRTTCRRPFSPTNPSNRSPIRSGGHPQSHLGEMLYNDPRLSSDNTVSCASCHNLQTGGVDNKAYSEEWASNSAASTPRPCSMPSTTSCSSGTAGRRILPNRPAARR